MKIYFYGGVESVTGSNFLLEKNNKKILIDCGLFQKERVCDLDNFLPFDFNPREILAVLVTHAHLDHIGRLPKLLKDGFNGYVYSTPPTKDLAYEILLDAQKIIEENCREFNNEGLYQKEDIDKLMKRWQTVSYHQKIKVDDFEIEFFNAGHVLGSSFIKIDNLVFSGDLGNKAKNLDPDLDDLPQVNYLVLESTYGDRNHENANERSQILEKIVEKVIYEKRTLIIPTFALERAQEIIYDLQNLVKTKKIPAVKIFLDSPLALRISKIYEKYPLYLDEKAKNEILAKGLFENEIVKVIDSFQEERLIFETSSPKIILAGSGMITGGRILKILKKYIEDPKTTILFIGYQAEGSLGRKILEGEKDVFIEDNFYKVKAEILTLFSYSAHLDQNGILNWIFPQRYNLKKIFLTHGDSQAKEALKRRILDELAIRTIIPKKDDFFEI
jgi:metallo-beta-lactamase family protein